MPGEIVSESWGFTQIKLIRFRYTWTISNFSFYCSAMGDKITSPSFSNAASSSELKWHLEINSNGWYLDDSNVSCMSVYLHLDSCYVIDLPANFKLSILNAKSEEVHKFEDNTQFGRQGKFHGNNSLIAKPALLNEKASLFPDDEFTICCDITVSMGRSNISEKLKSLPTKHPLAEDLEFLLKNPSYLSDVTLVSDGKEFLAHKAILATRSSVFKGMFEERKADRFEIKDVSQYVLDKMLQYIYTDQVSNLDKLGLAVFIAAEKYSLDGLKARCVNAIGSNVTVENACKILILGDEYHQAELKTQAKYYICTHASEVIKTIEWKSMTTTHSHLVTELFSAVVDLPFESAKSIFKFGTPCDVVDTTSPKSIIPTTTSENINVAKTSSTTPDLNTKSQKSATVVNPIANTKPVENTSSIFSSLASNIPDLKYIPVTPEVASKSSSINQILKTDLPSLLAIPSFPTTSAKHLRFLMSPSMDLKDVTDLPGIGAAYGSRLTQAGYSTADKVLKKFLELNKDRSDFEAWLRATCGANARWGPYCSEFLAEWCNNNGY